MSLILNLIQPDKVKIGEHLIDLQEYSKLSEEAYKLIGKVTEDVTPIKMYYFQMGYVLGKTLNSPSKAIEP